MTKKFFFICLLALSSVCFWSAESFLWTSHTVAASNDEEYAEEESVGDDSADAGTEEGEEVDEGDDDDDFDPDAPLPSPERVFGARLQTSDNVLLSATFYPGNRGKKSVPVLILHDWGGTRADVEVLAQALQAQGCAVLIPDLRGHGKSNRHLVGPEDTESFTAGKRMMLGDFEEILKFDLPCLKKFLMQQNNSGNLNIDKLCVGGVGYGGMAAAYFANNDWNPMVKRKKAQPMMGDVKGFFMIAPPKTMKGIKFTDTLTFPTWVASVSCLVLDGKNKKVVSAMEKQVIKCCGRDALERCWFKNYDSISETEKDLIQDPDSDIVLDILAFVDLRCTKRDILWKNRQ